MQRCSFWSVVALLALALHAVGQPLITDTKVELPVLKHTEFDVGLELAWTEGSSPPNGLKTLHCRALVDGKEVSSNTFDALDGDDAYVTKGTCESVKVPKNGMATVVVEVAYTKQFTNVETSDVRVRAIPGAVTVLPPIITVVLAIATRNVLVSLFSGVWVAAFFIHSYDPFRGFLRTIDTYAVNAFADDGHIKIILFNWFLCGVTGLIQRGGGGQGLANIIVKKAKTRRLTMLVCFICGVAIFFDTYANSLIIGTTFRPIMDAMLISREKLAYIVDATASPIASIAPISSWIGYELSLIDDAYSSLMRDGANLESNGWTTSSFIVFLKTIPGRYYPWAMLVLQVLLILLQRDFGPMFTAERRAHRTGKVYADDADKEMVKMNPELESRQDIPPRWWNAVIPILLIVFLVLLGLILTGIDAVEADPSIPMSIENVFGEGDSSNSLLWATLLATLVTWCLYRFQYFDGKRLMTYFNKTKDAKPMMHFTESESAWIEGIKQLVSTTLVLILAWTIGSVMQTLGTDDFIASGVSSAIDKRALSTLVFFLGAVISLATGTSWGTMAILFPVATKAAYQSDPQDEDLMISVIASILSGSVFGDHISPISDTTILSSIACRCDLMHHVKTQAPYAFFVGILAMFFGDFLSGYLYPMYAGLALTILAVAVGGFFLSAKPDSESDKVDLFNRLFGACGCCGLGALLKKRKAKKRAKKGLPPVGSSDSDAGTSDDERSAEDEAAEAGEGKDRIGKTDNKAYGSGSERSGSGSGEDPSQNTLAMQSDIDRSSSMTDAAMGNGDGITRSGSNASGAQAPPPAQAPWRQGTL